MDVGHEIRSKRKQPLHPFLDRPTKQMKTEAVELVADEETPDGEGLFEMDMGGDDARLLAMGPGTADSPEWQITIEKVVRRVVSIRFCQTCSFDTDSAITSEATGFVVDSEEGYILTNRHVVGAGPFWGHCVFDNHEEVRYPLA
jgi:S1-C subfamily serine protease